MNESCHTRWSFSLADAFAAMTGAAIAICVTKTIIAGSATFLAAVILGSALWPAQAVWFVSGNSDAAVVVLHASTVLLFATYVVVAFRRAWRTFAILGVLHGLLGAIWWVTCR